MTVAELIEKLQSFPQDMQVVTNTDGGFDSPNVHTCILGRPAYENADEETLYAYLFAC